MIIKKFLFSATFLALLSGGSLGAQISENPEASEKGSAQERKELTEDQEIIIKTVRKEHKKKNGGNFDFTCDYFRDILRKDITIANVLLHNSALDLDSRTVRISWDVSKIVEGHRLFSGDNLSRGVSSAKLTLGEIEQVANSLKLLLQALADVSMEKE